MASAWDKFPVAEQPKAARGWDAFPTAELPTPKSRWEAFPEEKPSFTEALMTRGPSSPTTTALGGAPIPKVEPTPQQTGAAAEELQSRTGGTFLDRILGSTTGMLTPEESIKKTQERVIGAEEAAKGAKATEAETKAREAEYLRSFTTKDGTPIVDVVSDLSAKRDQAAQAGDAATAKQIQIQINNTVANAPFEFRTLLAQQKLGVSETEETQARAEQARQAAVEAKLAPPVTQTPVRSGLETFGKTVGEQTAASITALQRVATAPVSLIEAVTGSEPIMSREIDKEAKKLNDTLAGGFAPDPAQAQDLGMKVVSGVASTATFAAAGPIGRGLRLAEPVSVAIAGALPQAEAQWQEAEARAQQDPSVNQEWRKWTSFATGLGVGATEAIPIGHLFENLEKASGGGLTRYFGIIAANGGEEAFQEGFQQILQNANSIAVLKDPNVTLSKDVADSILVAGLSGALFAGGVATAQGGIQQMRDLYKTPDEAPPQLRDILFPETKAAPAEATAPSEAPTVAPQPATAPTEAPTQDQAADLENVAVLKGAGLSVDDVALMSPRQRKAEAEKARKSDVKPAELTPDEASLFLPEPEAPAVPPSPAPAVEAQGAEAVVPSPSAPPAAPSEVAMGLVQQGVPPLEAMQQAAEQRAASTKPIEIQNGLSPDSAIDTSVFGGTKDDLLGPDLTGYRKSDTTPVNKLGILNKNGSIIGWGFSGGDIQLKDGTITSGSSLGSETALKDGSHIDNTFIKAIKIGQNSKWIKVRGPSDIALAEVFAPVAKPEPVVEAPKAEPVKPAPAPAKAKPKAPRAFWRAANLDTLVRKMGGVKDVGGDLKAANIPRNLINNKNGRPIEEIALDAIERGYYPDFKAQLEANADTATGNYQPTKEMVERVKADIGTKKLHPDYQEDVEAAKREGQEQFVLGPYLEEAQARAKELSISKDDPAVRAAATLAANGQAKDIEDAFNRILFADAAEIADDWNADRGEIAAAIGEDVANEIDDFLAAEGFEARGKPLEADYEPEPLPISETGPTLREEGQPAPEPVEEGRAEEPRKEVAQPVSVEAEKPEEGRLTAEEAQKMLNASLREGYTVRLSDKTEQQEAGKGLLISVPGNKSKTYLLNNKKELRDWIKGTIRLVPEEAKVKTSKMAEDLGPQGKPQLVIPGAEKVGQAEMLKRKAEAPMKPRVAQKEPGGLFSDERFQQDLFSSVQQKPEPIAVKEAEPKSLPMDKWLTDLAAKNDMIPIFSNGEVGLVLKMTRGFPEYLGVHRGEGKIMPVDVSTFSPVMFTADEMRLLRDMRFQAIKNDTEAYNENPDGPFAKSDIVVSENFPKNYGKIAAEWTKMANLPKGTRVMFTTPEDALKMKLTGDFRLINQTKTMLGDSVGVRFGVQKPNGEIQFHVITMQKNMKPAKLLETLSHELGHVIENEVWQSIPEDTKNAIKNAYINWRDTAKKGTGAALGSARAYRTNKAFLQTNEAVIANPATSFSQMPYFLSFSEWFADQTARWYNSQAKPLNVVERFFKRLADALRNFYSTITGQKFTPDEEFKKWMDTHVESNLIAIERSSEVLDGPIISRQQEELQGKEYSVPEDGFGAQFMYGMVDKYNDVSRVQKAIEAARGSPLPEAMDVEMSIQLNQDKAIAKQNAFYDQKVRPMTAYMKLHKISGDEAGRFLYAQHAPERNARMAQRDPSRFDGTNGSGLTTQEAEDYLNGLSPERRAVLKEFYEKHVKPILKADLEYRVDNGLITEEEFDGLTKPFEDGGYDYYVPLQGFAEDEADASATIPNIGKGFSVWGKEYRLAAGRKSKAMNPLYSAIQKRMDGIVRVEKNNTDRVLYNLIKNHPNPDLASIYTPKDLPKRPALRADGTIQYIPDFALARAEETLPLKIGGQQIYIVFNKENPTSKRLVRVLKNLTGDQVGIAGRVLLAAGRYMSNVNTQWVPDFFMTNMPRDIQDALVSIYSTREGFATNFMKEFARSGNIVRKVYMKSPLSPTEQQHYDEWVKSGGRLDFGGFATIEKTSKKFNDEFGDLFDTDRTNMEQLQRYFEKGGKLTLGMIEHFNQFFDDVTRFTVYRAARSDPNNRFSPDRAAQLARRATVDFRQRGQAMPFVNALYPYLSAGINGQRNFIRNLKTRRGKKILATLLLMGIANSLLGLAMSDDDETDPTKKKFYTEINQWERGRSFIIPIPINGKYHKIPLGFMGLFMFGLGDQLVGYMSGNIKATDAATNVVTSLLTSFVPFWSGGAVDSITPWVLQPVIDLWTNKNWLGNPIYPDRDTKLPKSSQALSTTPDWAKSAAQFANEWSGGSYTQPGWVDVYPATLDYFANMMTQGLKTFAVASYEPFRAYMNGEDIKPEKLPFLRRVTTRDTADKSAYYEQRNDIKSSVALARDALKIIKDRNSTKEMKQDARETLRGLQKELGISVTPDGVRIKNSVPDRFDNVDDRIKLLNEQIKTIQKSDKYTTEEKAAMVKKKEEMKKKAMDSARKAYLRKNKPGPSPYEQLLDFINPE